MSIEELNEEQLEHLKVIVFDENEDGTLDNILEYATNSNGQVSEVLIDYNFDGVADTRIFFEYDHSGRLIKKSKDTNLSGKIDCTETYNYSRSGEVTVEYDDNADGKVDFVETPDGEVKDIRDNAQKVTDTIVGMFPKNIRKLLKK